MREFRIPGVLQRFAGTYLITATMHLLFAKQNGQHQVNTMYNELSHKKTNIVDSA